MSSERDPLHFKTLHVNEGSSAATHTAFGQRAVAPVQRNGKNQSLHAILVPGTFSLLHAQGGRFQVSVATLNSTMAVD